jgi:hypothetical protein
MAQLRDLAARDARVLSSTFRLSEERAQGAPQESAGNAGDRLVATVASKKRASHELDASIGASEPHDFAVRIDRRNPHFTLHGCAGKG